MQPHLKKSQGFTMIEVSLVIIVMGILMVGLAPLLLRQHSGTMEARDATALEDAKTAIINYAITYGGIPDPQMVAGGPSGSYIGLMPPTTGGTPVPAFGVNNWGAYGDTSPFLLDVNDSLKSGAITYAVTTPPVATYTGGDRVVFCQNVNAQMAAAASLPAICQVTGSSLPDGGHTAATPCLAASASPAAFVLMSRGTDRAASQENDVFGSVVAPRDITNNRIYENDRRGIENSKGNYDDQVKSYPLSGFARDCREKMGVSAEVMSCAPGQKWVGSLTNNSAAAVTYTLSGTAPSVTGTTPGNSFTSYINTCVARTESMVAGNTIVLNAGDTNSDGRIDFVINVAGTLTSQ